VPISRSTWWRSAISGGDRATMSPVTRTSTPASKQRRKMSSARCVGLPGRGASSTPPIRPQSRVSITFGRPFRPCTASCQ
jgi:hypothetical protein